MYATASSQLTNALFANAAIVLASSELFFVVVVEGLAEAGVFCFAFFDSECAFWVDGD
jgi:hypothetical protein